MLVHFACDDLNNDQMDSQQKHLTFESTWMLGHSLLRLLSAKAQLRDTRTQTSLADVSHETPFQGQCHTTKRPTSPTRERRLVSNVSVGA